MRIPCVLEALRSKHTHTQRSAWKHYAVGGGCCAGDYHFSFLATSLPFSIFLHCHYYLSDYDKGFYYYYF